MSSTYGNIRSKTIKVSRFFQNHILYCLFLSDTLARSISDETEATVEQMPREQQTTPPPQAVRQNHQTCSFFGRRRRHRHPNRPRRYEVKINI
jgi:hypothetical protein